MPDYLLFSGSVTTSCEYTCRQINLTQALFVYFVPIGKQIWLPWAILNSDWLSFQKSFSLKRLGQMEPNCQEASMGGPF